MSETEVNTETEVTDDLDTFSTDFFGQKDVKTNKEVEQEPEKVEVETETQDKEADPNEDPEAEYKETPIKKKTVQDRIDELVKQREDAKREGETRIEQLRKEFEAKFATLQPKQSTVVDGEPAPDDTKEDGSPKYDLGEFDPQYIRDLTRYTLAQERNQAAKEAEVERSKQEQVSARGTLQVEWNTKVEAAVTEYPDFVEKGQQLLNGFNDLDSGYAEYLSTVLMQMDHGPAVLYYLSSNPDEATKIVNSGAQRATLALGRIEAKFIDAAAEKALAKPKVSKAPPPPTVRARGTNGAFITVAPDTDDLDAFSDAFFAKKR